jgi:hypothetical protein
MMVIVVATVIGSYTVVTVVATVDGGMVVTVVVMVIVTTWCLLCGGRWQQRGTLAKVKLFLICPYRSHVLRVTNFLSTILALCLIRTQVV